MEVKPVSVAKELPAPMITPTAPPKSKPASAIATPKIPTPPRSIEIASKVDSEKTPTLVYNAIIAANKTKIGKPDIEYLEALEESKREFDEINKAKQIVEKMKEIKPESKLINSKSKPRPENKYINFPFPDPTEKRKKVPCNCGDRYCKTDKHPSKNVIEELGLAGRHIAKYLGSRYTCSFRDNG